jgi:prophage regulatory protein
MVLRIKQVMKDFNLSRSFIYRAEKAGNFPRKIRLGPRAVGYLRSDLEAWLQSLKEQQA